MADTTATPEVVAERIRPAFADGDLTALRPLFAPEARWGNCIGGDEIIGWMQRLEAEGVDATLLDVEVHTDRVVLELELARPGGDDESAVVRQPHYLVAFVAQGQVIELRDAADRDEAGNARPSAPEPSPLGPRSRITTAVPILPVRDLGAALDHYRRLGFTARPYEGGGYGFVERGAAEMHLGEVPDLDPSTNVNAVCLFVEDADALHAEWRGVGVAGELTEPTDTDYGMREGAHVDPDGNRIRFGSPLHG